MIKLFITAIESRDDGTAVTLFEDYKISYDDKYDVYANPKKELSKLVYEKIEQVEEINESASEPL